MPQHATLRIGGPRSLSESLHMQGFCPDPMFRAGPLPVRVAVDGNALPEVQLRKSDGRFDISFPLPKEAMGKTSVEVTLDAGRSFRASGDSRDVSLLFGLFEIR
jgi:hypothetical protein